MILLISSLQPKAQSPIDERFGRTKWFMQLDTETNQWLALTNPGSENLGGSGVAAAQFAIDHKTEVIISGSFGPNAAKALRAANIRMVLFSEEVTTVQQAADYFLQGKLQDFA